MMPKGDHTTDSQKLGARPLLCNNYRLASEGMHGARDVDLYTLSVCLIAMREYAIIEASPGV